MVLSQGMCIGSMPCVSVCPRPHRCSHQSLRSGFGVGALEGYAPSLLPRWLAGQCGCVIYSGAQGPLVPHGGRPGCSDPFIAGVCGGGSLVAPGGQAGVRRPFPGSSSVLLLHIDAPLSGWGAHLLDLTASGVWSQEESSLRINVLEMMAVSRALVAFLPQLCCRDEWQHHGCCLSRASGWHGVSWKKNVLSGPDRVLPVEWSLLPRGFAGCSVISMSTSLPPSPMPSFLCTYLRSWTRYLGSRTRSSTLGTIYQSVPSTACSAQAGIVERSSFDRALVGSGGAVLAQEEWFADLLSLLVDEPLELLQVWNLLVQPHVRNFHRGLGTLRLLVWQLSSVLSERQAFLRRLCEPQLWASDTPLLPSTSSIGPSSSVGAVNEVSVPARCLSLR